MAIAIVVAVTLLITAVVEVAEVAEVVFVVGDTLVVVFIVVVAAPLSMVAVVVVVETAVVEFASMLEDELETVVAMVVVALLSVKVLVAVALEVALAIGALELVAAEVCDPVFVFVIPTVAGLVLPPDGEATEARLELFCKRFLSSALVTHTSSIQSLSVCTSLANMLPIPFVASASQPVTRVNMLLKKPVANDWEAGVVVAVVEAIFRRLRLSSCSV